MKMKMIIASFMAALLPMTVHGALMLDQIVPGAPALSDTGDELFSISDVDGFDDDVTTFILGRSAGFSNALGIYNPNDFTQTLQVYSGADPAGFGSGKVLQYDNLLQTYAIQGEPGAFTTWSSSVFGLYVDTGMDIWYSQNVLNYDGFDHLLTFSTEGLGGTTNGFDWVFAWEDLPNGGDQDWNDVTFGCIDCVAASVPVPAPLPLLLMGLGLIAASRKLRK